jgi:catechol 2,3-dioxygenase-like lactoylglutathione lyase family enzyme
MRSTLSSSRPNEDDVRVTGPCYVGAMSIQLQGLRSLIYPTADVTTAKAWWSDALGVDPYFDEPFYVGFNVGGYELGLVAAEQSDGPTTYWGVDDVADAVAQALLRGAVVRDEPSDVGEGIIVASVENPLGQLVGFIFNPHFVAS